MIENVNQNLFDLWQLHDMSGNLAPNQFHPFCLFVPFGPLISNGLNLIPICDRLRILLFLLICHEAVLMVCELFF
jgi:hypothetical protein